MTNKNQIFLFILLFCLFLNSSLKAECHYQQAIIASEFQIGIMLTWSTANENNNERFIIEKSENNADFEEIGTVLGAGTSEALQEYNFLHIYPREKNILYRLKELNYDGTISYSDIAIFNLERVTDVRIVRLSKSFTSSNFEIKLDSYTEGILSYKLKNWKGQIIEEESLTLVNGLNDIDLDVSSLIPGLYKVALTVNDVNIDELTFKRVLAEGEEKAPLVRKN